MTMESMAEHGRGDRDLMVSFCQFLQEATEHLSERTLTRPDVEDVYVKARTFAKALHNSDTSGVPDIFRTAFLHEFDDLRSGHYAESGVVEKRICFEDAAENLVNLYVKHGGWSMQDDIDCMCTLRNAMNGEDAEGEPDPCVSWIDEANDICLQADAYLDPSLPDKYDGDPDELRMARDLVMRRCEEEAEFSRGIFGEFHAHIYDEDSRDVSKEEV